MDIEGILCTLQTNKSWVSSCFQDAESWLISDLLVCNESSTVHELSRRGGGGRRRASGHSSLWQIWWIIDTRHHVPEHEPRGRSPEACLVDMHFSKLQSLLFMSSFQQWCPPQPSTMKSPLAQTATAGPIRHWCTSTLKSTSYLFGSRSVIKTKETGLVKAAETPVLNILPVLYISVSAKLLCSKLVSAAPVSSSLVLRTKDCCETTRQRTKRRKVFICWPSVVHLTTTDSPINPKQYFIHSLLWFRFTVMLFSKKDLLL